jgi:hypothetical protein
MNSLTSSSVLNQADARTVVTAVLQGIAASNKPKKKGQPVKGGSVPVAHK